MDSTADTFPKLLALQAERRAARTAIREKDYGIWQSWTWAEVREQVRRLACGLAEKGFQRGDTLAIVGDNRPRLYWSVCAAQCLGGVPVPLYQDSIAEEMRYVIEHAEAHFAVAEDQEQVDKLLEIREQCAGLDLIVYDDPRGLRHYDHAHLIAFDALQRIGAEADERDPQFLDAEIAKGRGEDAAVILYTSGTTGQPKGVVLTHDNLRLASLSGIQRDGLDDADEVLAYLPMAWVGDHVFSYCQSYLAGFCVSCPESPDTVLTDLREIGPTNFFAPPRIYETLLTTMMVRMEDAGVIKKRMFDYFLDVARRAGADLLAQKPVTLADRARYAVGRVLVYGPLKNTLGFSRIRLAYTAGEAIGPDTFDFYRSLGVNIKQLYGQTESAVFVTMQPDGEVKSDTVGTPAPGVELRISEEGEVLYRSPGVFREYFKNPEATAETKTTDGWVHTGDAGFLDDDGHLKIIDRAKDVGRLRGGTLFAPKYLENKLKFFPEIKEAVTFGHQRDYASAIINIDMEAVGSWAERGNLPYASYRELAAHPSVYELVGACVGRVNRDLAADSRLAASQIKRFLILHKELDADDGELTRTRKVRRRHINDKYGALIEALYSDADRHKVDAEVRFEDGSSGVISAELLICDAQTVD